MAGQVNGAESPAKAQSLLSREAVVPAAVPVLTHRAARAAGGLAILGLYLCHAWLFGDYVADDAGISLAYGRNLAAGFGPVLYPGGEAVEGYSNPLWTALLGAAAALRLDGADGIPLLKGLGLCFGAATLLLTGYAAGVAYPSSPRITWLAPALLASLTPFVFWTASGLENGLYAFLMLLAVVLQLREVGERHPRPWSALALGGLALTRPEGVAFFVLFLAHRMVCGVRGRGLVAWVAVFAGIYALFLTSRVLVFGDWLPNTYYAKVGIYDRQLWDLPRYLATPDDRGRVYVWTFVRDAWPLVLIAAFGLADRRAWRTGLLLAGVAGGTMLYAVYVGGDFWPAARFFTATLPLAALAAQHGIERWTPGRAVIGTVCAAALAGIVLNRSITASAELRVTNAGDALISLQGRLAQGRRVRALTEALGIRDPLVLDADIGGPTLAGLRVLDLGGLTDIHIARFHYYAPFFRSYIFDERRPDVIRTHASWTRSSGITAFPEFDAQYVAISSKRDSLGLHGEFIRRDRLVPGGEHVERDADRASFWQAVEDGRARRARETQRARSAEGHDVRDELPR